MMIVRDERGVIPLSLQGVWDRGPSLRISEDDVEVGLGFEPCIVSFFNVESFYQ